MRGKKHPPELKEKAKALLSITDNVMEVSREMGIPDDTIYDWKKKEFKKDDSFTQLQEQRKAKFIEMAWEGIEAGLELGNMKVKRAKKHEKELDLLIAEIEADKTIKPAERMALVNKVRQLQINDIRAISTYVGTLYDKHALAKGDATANVNLNMSFEDKLEELFEEE